MTDHRAPGPVRFGPPYVPPWGKIYRPRHKGQARPEEPQLRPELDDERDPDWWRAMAP